MLLDRLPQVPRAIVLLHLDDAVGRAALREFEAIEDQLPSITAYAQELTPDAIQLWQVGWSPTYLVFRFGNEIARHRGRLNRDELMDFVRSVP